MGKYLKMADVFSMGVAQEDSFLVSKDGEDLACFICYLDEDRDLMAKYALHAINSHDELVEINKYLLSKLKEIDECFEAAYIDGLSDAFANEDIYTIKDIYCRRIEFARGVAVSAICKENK